jgi:hypothetical protein
MSDVQETAADAASESATPVVDQTVQASAAVDTAAEPVATDADVADVSDAKGEDAEPVQGGQAEEVHPAVGELNALRATIKAELNAILTGIRTRVHNGEAHLVSLIERL